MKPRELMVTIEMLTDIPLKEFTRAGIHELFHDGYRNDGETLTVHQVRTQVIKENK